MSHSNKKKILLCLTGSIACYKACYLISSLIKEGFEIQTVATESALQFIGKASLEGLTDKTVMTSMFEEGKMKAHINLARNHDLILIYPATANTINKLSAGISDDLIGGIFLANNFQKPFWIAPAMNGHMLEHVATQSSLEKLEKWGCKILPTEQGMLACHEFGSGKALDPIIVKEMIMKELA